MFDWYGDVFVWFTQVIEKCYKNYGDFWRGGDEAVKIPGLGPGMRGVAVRYEDFGGDAPSAGLRPGIAGAGVRL